MPQERVAQSPLSVPYLDTRLAEVSSITIVNYRT